MEAALARGHPEVARVLVAAKADVVNHLGMTAYALWRERSTRIRNALLATRDALRARGDDGPRDAPALAAMLERPRMRRLLEEEA